MNLEQNNKGASGVALKYLLAAAQAHIGRIETSHQSLLENTVGALRLDSRLCEAGDIFVAFAGKQVDGHDYIAQVIEKDVAAIVVSNDWAQDHLHQFKEAEVVFILCHDQQLVMRAFAQGYREYYRAIPFIGITGSCGKTTVKNLTAHILDQFTDVLVTAKSQNNHLGVPMTISRITPATKIGVAELGANHVGEIQQGASLVKPDIGVLTCVNAAHIEGFGSLEKTAKAKGELIEAIGENGIAVLNRDDEFFSVWVDLLPATVKSLTFGQSAESDIQYFTNDAAFSFIFNQGAEAFGVPAEKLSTKITVNLPLLGEYNKMNAVIAIAAVVALGYKVKPEWLSDFYSKLDCLFESAQAEPGRLVPVQLANGTLMIDDTWNAVPTAVKGSIQTLSQFAGPKWFVFGGMAELGEHCLEAHEEIGLEAAQCQIDRFWAFGPDASHAAETYAKNYAAPIACFETHEAMNAALLSAVNHSKPATLLVKGSRSRKMEKIVQHLQSAIGLTK